MALESYDSFEAVKTRLDEIVDAVSDDELALDDALALYEEAVGLGLRASDLLEDNIETQQSVEGADEVVGRAVRRCARTGDGCAGFGVAPGKDAYG